MAFRSAVLRGIGCLFRPAAACDAAGSSCLQQLLASSSDPCARQLHDRHASSWSARSSSSGAFASAFQPSPSSSSMAPASPWIHHFQRPYSSESVVSLSNLRDNPKATKQRIRVGRGNSSNRGNYCGRGMNGQNSRGRGAHLLYDGGQLGLLKFPVSRERPPYEVLFTQLGVGKLVEYIQLGLLKTHKVITMKDLQDVGCVARVKYGVLLYGKVRPSFPLHIQVTACDPETKSIIEAAGGSVTRVYYEEEGLRGLLNPTLFTRKKLPLPLPAHSWHPRYNGKFDSVGQLPPVVELPSITARTKLGVLAAGTASVQSVSL